MNSRIGVALTFLRNAGFRSTAAPRGRRYFDGDLKCRAGTVPVRLQITDWDFVSYPAIHLRERPAFLSSVSPHLFGTNGLCYFAARSVILDRYRPEVALSQCLEQARDVLDRLSSDADYRQREFETEFGATWMLGQLPIPVSLLLGSVGAHDEEASCYFLDGQNYAFVSTQQQEVDGFCKARGWSKQASRMTCWLLRTASPPTLPAAELPKTVAHMFAWLRLWGRDAYQRLQTILGKPEYLASSTAMFLIHSPAGWFGFTIKLDQVKRTAYKRRPTRYRQFLHNHGHEVAVSRLAVTEVGSDFVHSRNLSFPSLKDRRITLIGCGAIGGYLAQALAKLGAGSGTKGRLTLIDPDVLAPGNLGRHYLGIDHLYAKKPEALKAALLQQFPALTLIAEPRSVDFAKDLSGDLVINATGEEALSEALNHYHTLLPSRSRPPMLHVWILGNGQCVQALWVDLKKFACYRCLRLPDLERTPRFEPLREPTQTRVLGCNAFTPYAVSAPMSAAALAIDMTAGWLQGDPGPRFRTRFVEAQAVREIKNQNLSPLTGCPACSTTRSG